MRQINRAIIGLNLAMIAAMTAGLNEDMSEDTTFVDRMSPPERIKPEAVIKAGAKRERKRLKRLRERAT